MNEFSRSLVYSKVTISSRLKPGEEGGGRETAGIEIGGGVFSVFCLFPLSCLGLQLTLATKFSC